MEAVIQYEFSQRDSLGPVGARTIEGWSAEGEVAVEAKSCGSVNINGSNRRENEIAHERVKLVDDYPVADGEKGHILHAPRGGTES